MPGTHCLAYIHLTNVSIVIQQVCNPPSCVARLRGVWEVGYVGRPGKILQLPIQRSAWKNPEKFAVVLGTFWEHKTLSSQSTPVLHYPLFFGVKTPPLPGSNQRYKHSFNLTIIWKQQKAECKQNQSCKHQSPAWAPLCYSITHLEREKKNHPNFQIQLGHEGIWRLQFMLCIKTNA